MKGSELWKVKKNMTEQKVPAAKPVYEFRAKGVRASIWKNERKNDKGEKFDTFSVGVVRRYMDKEKNWQETNSFGVDDLPALVIAAQKAYEYCVVKARDPAE